MTDGQPRDQRAAWWLDHLAGSSIVAIFYPLWPFFTWPLVVPAGTVLRLVAERHGVSSRRDVFRRVWIMVAVGTAIFTPFAATDDRSSGMGEWVAGYLFGVLWFVILPALLYALAMPLAGQRWFSWRRFRRTRS